MKNEENLKLLKQNRCLIGLNPEIGHVKTGFEPIAAVYTLIGKYGKLVHCNWNSRLLVNYDQDLNTVIVDIKETYALLHAFKIMSHKKYVGVDIFQERISFDIALKININMINKMISKIENLPHEEIMNYYLEPTENRGELEKMWMNYLI
ncbi:MAG: hypothetical protein EAX96_07155 [Candidatus Lokiarchaeota archaeon]|nr:hypothetical protein [Candidatus Lokiarchaeota archaeon]